MNQSKDNPHNLDLKMPIHLRKSALHDNKARDELTFKSELFNALEVFDLEQSSRTPDGTKFWNDVKKAAERYAESRVAEALTANDEKWAYELIAAGLKSETKTLKDIRTDNQERREL